MIEGFWSAISQHYQHSYNILLVYPSISQLPEVILHSPIQTETADFTDTRWRAIFSHCRMIHKHRIKYIYFSDQSFRHPRYVLYRLAGVRRIIVHDHAPGNRDQPNAYKATIKRLLSRLPLINADAMIGATEFVRRRHIEVNCIDPKRCFVASNGISLASPPPSSSPYEVFGIPSDRRIIVSTGRAHPVKNIDFALHCIQRLVHELRRKDVHFLHCGDGPDLTHLQQLSDRLGIREFVTFAGRQENIGGLLPHCYAAFHPSLAEVGYSLSILEYMWAGLPVVVSDDPSVCEATQHQLTGLRYQSGDIDSACSSLTQLLDDPDLASRLGSRAREVVAAAYSLENTHRQLLTALSSVIPVH
jgi:glycosyltransferase involved in cell wall biosynthesis